MDFNDSMYPKKEYVFEHSLVTKTYSIVSNTYTSYPT